MPICFSILPLSLAYLHIISELEEARSFTDSAVVLTCWELLSQPKPNTLTNKEKTSSSSGQDKKSLSTECTFYFNRNEAAFHHKMQYICKQSWLKAHMRETLSNLGIHA